MSITLTFTADDPTTLALELREVAGSLTGGTAAPDTPALDDLSVDEIILHLQLRVRDQGLTVKIVDDEKAQDDDKKEGEQAAAPDTGDSKKSTKSKKKSAAKSGTGSKEKSSPKNSKSEVKEQSKNTGDDDAAVQKKYDMALEILMELYQSGHQKKVKALLDTYKVAKFSDIAPGKGATLLVQAEKLRDEVAA